MELDVTKELVVDEGRITEVDVEACVVRVVVVIVVVGVVVG